MNYLCACKVNYLCTCKGKLHVVHLTRLINFTFNIVCLFELRTQTTDWYIFSTHWDAIQHNGIWKTKTNSSKHLVRTFKKTMIHICSSSILMIHSSYFNPFFQGKNQPSCLMNQQVTCTGCFWIFKLNESQTSYKRIVSSSWSDTISYSISFSILY